ncbi:MAG: methionine--tRNA ligase subunit beta [Candidatus Micrarchaeia archaeon]|jgi:methionine--tRNA ligase beta chain
MLSYEEFSKLDLRIAKIEEVEEIEGSEKLYKLTISLGEEKRTIVAGIRKEYKKEELLGKEIVIVANLEPKTIKGIVSRGMLLAAVDNGKISLLIPEKEVTPGTKVS